MNESTVTKMKQMKLYGMHNAFKTAIESGKTDHYTLDQFVSMLIDAEWDERHNRRIARSITNARFHYKSNIESINFDQTRNLDRNTILRLAECEFVEKNENILITGSTGVGKSYLGTALGYQACIQGFKVSYFNTSKLFAKLKMAKADGIVTREEINVFKKSFRVPPNDAKRVAWLFDQAKKEMDGYEGYANQLYSNFYNQPAVLEQIVDQKIKTKQQFIDLLSNREVAKTDERQFRFFDKISDIISRL